MWAKKVKTRTRGGRTLEDLMRKGYIAGILVVSVCAAQTHSPTPTEIDALEAALRADMRGTEDAEASRQPRGLRDAGKLPLEILPPQSRADRPSTGSVSVGQLRHKPPKNAQKSVTRGARFSEGGDHRRAAEEFEKAIADDPQFANAYDRLGVEYAQLGRHGEAEAQLRRSLALDPASWRGHYDLGVILYQTGDLPGAEKSLQRALELSKANAQVHLLLGVLLWRRVDARADALQHLQYAARSIPQAQELLTSLQEK
jgi:tetratricopeptide (TPR) repeat protein